MNPVTLLLTLAASGRLVSIVECLPSLYFIAALGVEGLSTLHQRTLSSVQY